MLSAPEVDLVRRDGALPGLATVLDPEALLATLAPALDTSEIRVASVRYVRYKPHTNCLAAYRLELNATPPRIVDVHAKAHRPDASEKLDKASRRPGVPGYFGPGRIVFEDRALVVWSFPNDPHLKAVRRLADGHARGRLLAKMLPDRPDLRGAATTLEPLRYKPERRFVGRLDTANGPQAILKVHAAPRYERAANGASSLGSRGSLRVPRMLGRADAHCIIALEWLSGRPLGAVLGDGGASGDAVAQVGGALSELHAQRSARITAVEPHAAAAGLLALARDIAFLCPELARHAHELAGRLVVRLRDHSAQLRAIHGDFNADQVLLTNDGVAIFDLDRAALGDPAADLGTFAAHLEREALRGHLPRGQTHVLREALLDGYGRATRRPVPPRVNLYTAIGLFRLIPEPFRGLESDWPEHMAALLTQAEAAAAA